MGRSRTLENSSTVSAQVSTSGPPTWKTRFRASGWPTAFAMMLATSSMVMKLTRVSAGPGTDALLFRSIMSPVALRKKRRNQNGRSSVRTSAPRSGIRLPSSAGHMSANMPSWKIVYATPLSRIRASVRRFARERSTL
jgi:hypothetical protein